MLLLSGMSMHTHVQPYSEQVIESMVDALCSLDTVQANREAYREALRGLVRLGQAEQLLSMQLDFNRMTAGCAQPPAAHG